MKPAAPSWALMSVVLPKDAETLEAAARSLNVPGHAIDPGFGLVPIDRSRGLYAVQVDAGFLEAAPVGEPYRGPFSDPPIAPFSLKDEK